MRLDLVINAMSYSALTKGVIHVHGGEQMRPNIHIEDMAHAYLHVLNHKTHRKTYNVGTRNLPLADIAKKITQTFARRVIDTRYEISTDPRSYRVDSDFIFQDIGFLPKKSITEAIKDIDYALLCGHLPDKPTSMHINVQRMKEVYP